MGPCLYLVNSNRNLSSRRVRFLFLCNPVLVLKKMTNKQFQVKNPKENFSIKRKLQSRSDDKAMHKRAT